MELELLNYVNSWLMPLLIWIIIVMFVFIWTSSSINSSIVSHNVTLDVIWTMLPIILLVFLLSPCLLLMYELETIHKPSLTLYIIGNQWCWTYIPINNGYFTFDGLMGFGCVWNWVSMVLVISYMSCNYSYFYLTLFDIYISLTLGIFWTSLMLEYCFINFNFVWCNNLMRNNVLFFGLAVYWEQLLIPVNSFNGLNTLFTFNLVVLLIGYVIGATCCISQLSLSFIFDSSSLTSSQFQVGDSLAMSYLLFSTNFLLLPLYAHIKLIINSIDVIHSWGLFSFGINLDALPGRYNLAICLHIITIGIGYGFCYELCGIGHYQMLISTFSL